MTCKHCCGADLFFDEKEAKKEWRRYQKNGPSKTTRKLIDNLIRKDLKGLSLLDIGGGIGALQFELLNTGVSSSTDIDASNGYIHVAEKAAKEMGLDGSMQFITGDFVVLHREILQHDIVTLEKVICCYPDIEALLDNSLSKCRKYYGIVYPRDGMAAKLATGLVNLYFRLKGNPFRTYIHPVEQVRSIILKNGMKPFYRGSSFPWIIEWYKR